MRFAALLLGCLFTPFDVTISSDSALLVVLLITSFAFAAELPLRILSVPDALNEVLPSTKSAMPLRVGRVVSRFDILKTLPRRPRRRFTTGRQKCRQLHRRRQRPDEFFLPPSAAFQRSFCHTRKDREIRYQSFPTTKFCHLYARASLLCLARTKTNA